MSISLRSRALKELKLGIAIKVVGQALLWFSTLYTVRLLNPDDYGLLSMSFVLITFSGFISEMGLGASIVQARTLHSESLAAIFGWVLFTNLLLAAAFWFGAESIGRLFDEPEIVPLIKVLIVTLPFRALSVLPAALLIRELRIKDLEFVTIIANLTSGLLTLWMAFKGYGVWALVMGQVALVAIRCGMLLWGMPTRVFPTLAISRALDNLKFGGWKALGTVAWEFIDRIDYFVLGILMKKTDVGVYSVAIRFASLPLDKVGGLIQSVGLSSFSKVQDDAEVIASNVVRATQLAAMIAFPVFVGMSLIAHEIVGIVFGAKWLAASAPMVLICLVQPFRLLHNILVPAVDAVGKPAINAWVSVVAAVGFAIGFYAGARVGIIWVAAAWLIVMIPWFLWAQSVRLKSLQISRMRYMRSFVGPTMASILMAALTLGIVEYLPLSSAWQVLLVKIVLGAVCYTASIFLMSKQAVIEVIGWLRPGSHKSV